METEINTLDQSNFHKIPIVLYNTKSASFDKEDNIGNIVKYIKNNYKTLNPNSYDIYVLKIALYLLRKYFMHKINNVDLKIFAYIIPACISCINYYKNCITILHYKTRYNFLDNMMNKLMPLILDTI